jgi:hypothetical protein
LRVVTGNSGRQHRQRRATEEKIAATLDRVANVQLHRVDHLRAQSAEAREHAARARQWARDHSRPGHPAG